LKEVTIMRRLIVGAAAGLFLAPLLALAGPAKSPLLKPGKEDTGCGSFGTKVEFVESPSEAAKLAKKEEKLVFVLHVSGNFEDPRFT
jgi:hypothetical protein